MKKLSKKRTDEANTFTFELDELYTALSQAIDTFNTEIEEAKEAVEKALSEYNDKLSEVRDYRDEIVSDMDGYMEERSEKWHEGEAGQAFQSWHDIWEQLEFEDVEIEFPEPLETPDVAENPFEDVPFEVES